MPEATLLQRIVRSRPVRPRLRPPVLTLAMRSRLGADLVEILDKPYGTVVDMVLDELEAAGFLRRESGYWGGVAPAPRARVLNGFETWRIEEGPDRRERDESALDDALRERDALRRLAVDLLHRAGELGEDRVQDLRARAIALIPCCTPGGTDG